MQLEFDFGLTLEREKKFYLTIGRFSEELCYTAHPSYTDVKAYSEDQVLDKLLVFGYSAAKARALISKAKKKEQWLVYSYQQCFNF